MSTSVIDENHPAVGHIISTMVEGKNDEPKRFERISLCFEPSNRSRLPKPLSFPFASPPACHTETRHGSVSDEGTVPISTYHRIFQERENLKRSLKGTAANWVQMPRMKPGPDSVGIFAISQSCGGVAARACNLVSLEPTKIAEILKDRFSWLRDYWNLEVFTMFPAGNGGTIELVYTQIYSPTKLNPARDFWTLRYTTTLENGSLVALRYIRQIAQETSSEIVYGLGRQPVVLRTFSQRLKALMMLLTASMMMAGHC